MPSYVTPYEIKLEMPDTLAVSTITYDVVLRRNAEQASKLIEKLCGRQFFALRKTLYLEPAEETYELWLPVPVLDIIGINMTTNYGSSFSVVTEGDYIKYGSDEFLIDGKPYYMLSMSGNGSYSYWYSGEKSVQITCITGWHEDYDNAWDTVAPTVQDNPLSISSTSLTVLDADIVDAYGHDLFQIGQVLKLEDEQVAVTHINAVSNVITIKRGIHGTNAATHAKETAIAIYRCPLLVSRACAIQSMRWFKRGQQAYTDTSATPEQGQLTYTQRLDPDIKAIIIDAGLTKVVV